jgi:hypothetical protein
MLKRGASFLTPIVLMLAAGCGHGSTGPSAVTYAGEWNGTTSQGTPITFSVSSDKKLTRISVSYNFNGCTGSATFSPSVSIEQVPTAPVPVGSASYESASVGTPNRMLISFLFTSATDAHGMLIFVDYPGCGTAPASAAWTARRG